MKVFHEFDAVYDKESKILILGSIPSVKSRQYGFYYMHPKNRFWKTIEYVLNQKVPESIEEKVIFLKNNRIALWDVIASCEIVNSNDATIKDIIPNDIQQLIKKTKIKAIFTTGKKATELYQKYCFPNTLIEAIYLPSTSPANCSIKIDTLIEEYKKILPYLKNED